MNTPIIRLFGLITILFAVLIAFTSRWAVFGAPALHKNQLNARVAIEQQKIKRGVIRADDGKVLAGSVKEKGDVYTRRYPTGSLFGQPVGWSDPRFGNGGLERFYNDDLTGDTNEFAGIVDSLTKKVQVGDDLDTTLDPKAQQAAYDALAGRPGAVVAMDVKTGAVRALAGNPRFDPSTPSKNQFITATQGLYPPGSTFKTVTATAAIDTGRYQPDSKVSGKNHKIISGTPLDNFGGEDYGDVDLTFALTHSINTVWAEVGVKIGKATLAEYMDRFGFGAKPPMDFPPDQMSTSGSYRKGSVISEKSRFVDVGRTAIGQALLLVTPLQMATVAQTIGNGGVRMEPRLVKQVVDPDGRTVDTPLPKEAQRVMSTGTAAKLTAMMKQVVKEGTGTAAALEGVEVAGKTGTAEIDIQQGINDLWFIGFTPTEAVAVVLDHQKGGQGGTIAAPVAKAVLQALGVLSMQSIGPETIVDGRYRILHKLGSGGMAEVWAAEDSQLGRRVALKLLASRYAEDPDFRERFRREASAAAAMQHPNIVSIYDRGEWDGTSYIAMELVDGRTLKQLIVERGPAGPSAAVDITIEILKALRYAHKRGIVHRDIKPQNVLLDDEGGVKVADFGIARAESSEMTEDGAIMGTVQYVSPEQAQGLPVSPSSDLYSAGIVLYELLTGRVPFDGEAPVSIALKQVNEPPVPPSQFRPGIPPALEAVVTHALEKDPARRYASADEFIGALEAARRAPVHQVGMEPTPGEPWERLLEEEQERGSRWWLWVLALVAVAVIAGGAYVLLAGSKVTVPDVTGEVFSDAASKLHERGLEVTPVNAVSDSVASGRVISTSPPAGEKVKKDSSVVVRVSVGKGTAQIPQVVGESEDDAKQALTEAGFNPKVKTAFSDSVPKGQVISSDPPQGETHSKTSTVTLTVSKGKQGETVPKLTGLSQDDALSALSDVGLTPNITFKESSEDPGTVLSQSPAAGTVVDKGSSVGIVVAKERPEVPDVTTGNPSEADATKTLQAAGYKVQTRPDNSSPASLEGKVTGQDPQPGERRSSGATVIIKIGAAPTPTPTPTPTASPTDTPTPTPTTGP